MIVHPYVWFIWADIIIAKIDKNNKLTTALFYRAPFFNLENY